MANQVIDRLVSSLASGLMGADEFMDAVEGQARVIRSANTQATTSATGTTAGRCAPQH
jgi:hypothetical protein